MRYSNPAEMRLTQHMLQPSGCVNLLTWTGDQAEVSSPSRAPEHPKSSTRRTQDI